MSKHSYQLVNPIIEGTFNDVYDAKNPIKAADHMWKSLSEHILSHVPKFMFTMKDISSGKHHHFEVNEQSETGKYTINQLDLDIDDKKFSEFAQKVDTYSRSREQHGGRRKRYEDSSSSSSSSSTDYYPTVIRTSPISMFHYTTRLYTDPIYKYESTLNPQAVLVTTPLFTPIFRPNLGTFVGIWP